MQVLSLTEVRNNFKEIFEKVFYDKEEVIIHRKGRENIVLISLDEYNALKETNYLLKNKNNAKHLFESIKQLQNQEVVMKEIKDLQ